MPDGERYGVVPLAEMPTDDVPATGTFPELAAEARCFLERHRWCPPFVEQSFAVGVPGVVGVFLFRLAAAECIDPVLWVVVGDLPSVYLVVDEARDGVAALERYCELMEDWARAVLDGASLEGHYPVPVTPDAHHARLLLTRVGLLRADFIPTFRDGISPEGEA